jgi:hypothetical protein
LSYAFRYICVFPWDNLRLINLKRNLFDLAGAKNRRNSALETCWAYF